MRNFHRWFGIAPLIACASLPSGNAVATTWTILPNGTGDAPTIQAGIDSAANGDTVSLANGTFQGAGNYDLTMNGKQLVLRSQSGDSTLAVIDPQLQGRAFVFNSGEPPSSIVESITIRNGKLQPGSSRGGAMVIRDGASPTIRSTRFEANRAPNHPLVIDPSGGAIGIMAGSTPLFDDCVFFNNWAPFGGAISCEDANVEIVDCEFIDNQTTHIAGHGGAIWTAGTTHVDITESRFQGCSSEQNGGAIFFSGTVSLILDCDFEGNTATTFEGRGGAVYLQYSDVEIRDTRFVDNEAHTGGALSTVLNTPEVQVQDCYFENNQALRRGGAVHIDRDAPVITDCSFVENQCVWYGGAILSTDDSDAQITGCLFLRNVGTQMGGAVSVWDNSIVTVDQCTFYANTSGAGAGWHVRNSTLNVDRSIVFANTGAEAVFCEMGGTATFLCSNVFGNSGGDWVNCLTNQWNTNGNIWLDPLFCDAAGDDFTLDYNSPSWLAACGRMGAFDAACPVQTDVAGGVDTAGVIPRVATLSIAPNPFNPTTTISLGVPQRAHMRVAVHDIAGREVAVLVDRALDAGTHDVAWRGRDASGSPVASGVYFVRSAIGDARMTRKITLIR